VITIPAETAPIQRAHEAAFIRLFTGHKMPRPLCICRIDHPEYLDCNPTELDSWLKAAAVAVQERIDLAAHRRSFHPLLLEFWPLGVHFVDAVFGARVYKVDGNFWSDQLPCGLSDLAPVDVESSPLVRWAMDSMEKALAALPEAVSITTPVFSSPLNIALNLFNDRCLTGIISPGRAERRGLEIITNVIASLHRHVRRRFTKRVRFYASSSRWAPDGFGHICGCSTQLVGPQQYAREIAPLDESILNVYPEGGTIHLCGRHTQHIPCWRQMQYLRGVQLNNDAADDFEIYFKNLRDDQVIYITPTANMPVDRILAISGGQRVVLQARLES